MSGLTQAVSKFRNIWGQGDEDYSPDEIEDDDDVSSRDSGPSRDTHSRDTSSRASSSSYSAPSYASSHTPSHGGGGSSAAPRPRRIPSIHPGLRGRDKNIYTIKPKSQDDATIAADCLKTGDAVIVNLEDVDKVNAVRIVDFMSGVCYGLEARGHAMKLGDAIFLYTPGDFEIRSDEVDYGENEDLFFIDENPIEGSAQPQNTVRAQVIPASQIPQHLQQQQQAAAQQAAAQAAIAPTPIHVPPTPSGYINPASTPNTTQRAPLPGAMPIPDRRTWER